MTHGSLFSGIGGFDISAEWMGWENKFHCENNSFCQRVLKYYWPDAEQYGDIKTTDFKKWMGAIDILSGGFPCQPFSAPGKRKGTADTRHLWPEMLRAVGEIKPSWVIGENVYGLVNWDGGLVFDKVQSDLETEGYEVFPVLLPACGVNAPHRRYRIWFIAHSNRDGDRNIGKQNTEKDGLQKISGKAVHAREFIGTDTGTIANTNISERREGRLHQAGQHKTKRYAGSFGSWNDRGAWENFPTQPPLRERNDGLSSGLAGITVSKHRNESIKGYGNAVVPQVVYQIFKAIEQYENL